MAGRLHLLLDFLEPRPGLGWLMWAGLAAFAAVLVFCAVHDWRTRTVPNAVTVPAIVISAAWSAAAFGHWQAHLAAGAAMGILFGAMAMVRIRGSYGFGMGDAKLLAVCGFCLAQGSALMCMAAALLGLAAGAAGLTGATPGRGVPFAPWIAAGSLLVLAAAAAAG